MWLAAQFIKVEEAEAAVEKIQARVRAHQARKEFFYRKVLALRVQAVWRRKVNNRMVLSFRRALTGLDFVDDAPDSLQLAAAQLDEEQSAIVEVDLALPIQVIFRMRKRQKAVRMVQRHIRGWRARKHAARRSQALVKTQALVRGANVRGWFRKRQQAVLKLQTACRRWQVTRREAKKSRAATRLQAAIRRVLAVLAIARIRGERQIAQQGPSSSVSPPGEEGEAEQLTPEDQPAATSSTPDAPVEEEEAGALPRKAEDEEAAQPISPSAEPGAEEGKKPDDGEAAEGTPSLEEGAPTAAESVETGGGSSAAAEEEMEEVKPEEGKGEQKTEES